MVTGIMKERVTLAGVLGMALEPGQQVILTAANNIPNAANKWFARPLSGVWSDGVERSSEDSILIDEADLLSDEEWVEGWEPACLC
jgi:hypothetical protein